MRKTAFHTKGALRILRAFFSLIIILSMENARAGNEILENVQLISCNTVTCINLVLPQAERSPLDTIYVFGSARMKISLRQKIEDWGAIQFKQNMVQPTIQDFQGIDGYYDPDAGRIVLRGIEGRSFTELVFNLNNGNITQF